MNDQIIKLYRYKALRRNGVTTKGVISAYSETHLHEQLEKVDIQLLSCSEVKKGYGFLNRAKKITIRDKIQLFKSLEQMQTAGIPLLSSIDHCCRSASHSGVRDMLNAIHMKVGDGMSLSESMEDYPNVFNKIEMAVIKSKEKSGDLKGAFTYLTNYLVKKDELIRRIKKATRYPMILMFVIFITILVMLGYVTPQILSFVQAVQTDAEIPFMTTSLMATSSFFQSYLYIILGVLVFSIAFIRVMKKQSTGFRYKYDKFLLGLPVFGELIRKLEISRFSSTLSSLYSSGINLMESITLSKDVIENTVIQSSAANAIESLKEGSSLNAALNETGEFPALVIQMIAIAEESGGMSEALDQVVDFYEKDIDESISTMVTSIEPALTVILALMIVWIAGAVFGPIYSSFENIEF